MATDCANSPLPGCLDTRRCPQHRCLTFKFPKSRLGSRSLNAFRYPCVCLLPYHNTSPEIHEDHIWKLLWYRKCCHTSQSSWLWHAEHVEWDVHRVSPRFSFFPMGTWTQQLQCLCPWSWISRLFSTKDSNRAGRPLCACCASQIPATVCIVLCTSFCRTPADVCDPKGG